MSRGSVPIGSGTDPTWSHGHVRRAAHHVRPRIAGDEARTGLARHLGHRARRRLHHLARRRPVAGRTGTPGARPMRRSGDGTVPSRTHAVAARRGPGGATGRAHPGAAVGRRAPAGYERPDDRTPRGRRAGGSRVRSPRSAGGATPAACRAAVRAGAGRTADRSRRPPIAARWRCSRIIGDRAGRGARRGRRRGSLADGGVRRRGCDGLARHLDRQSPRNSTTDASIVRRPRSRCRAVRRSAPRSTHGGTCPPPCLRGHARAGAGGPRCRRAGAVGTPLVPR